MKKIFTLIAMAVMALSASAQNTYGIFMDETTLGGTLMGVTEEAIGFTPGVITAGDVKVTYTNGKDTKYIAELEKTFGANFFLSNNFNNASFQYRPYIANGSVNATWTLMDGGVLVCTGFKNGTDETAAGFIGSDADAASRWPENENNDETQPKIDYFSKNLYEIAQDYWTGMTIEVPAGQALNVDEISVAIGGGNAFYWSVAIFNETGELLYDSKVAQAQNNFYSTDAGKQGNICGFSADITAAGVSEPLGGYNFMPASWHSSAGYFDNFIGETALPITLEKADKMKAAGWDPTNGKSPVRRFQPLPVGLKLTGKNTVRVYFGCKNSRLFGLPYLYVKGSLEEYAEFESNGIYYYIFNDTSCEVQVTSGNNKYSGNITIPEKVIHNGKEYSVKSIASYAFSRSSGLNSVTIPNSVNSIGDNAFYGCSGLTSVTIPNSVTRIGDYAFLGCSGLTSVIIPNSVTSIEGSAFEGCSGLTSVHTDDLSAWCKIDFANTSSNPTYYAKKLYLNGEEVKNLVIPTSVSTIGRYSFYNCDGIISVTIPNSVTSIGNSAFSGCSGLTSVTIPNSVTSIGGFAFSGCSSLKNLHIEDGDTELSLGYDLRDFSNEGQGLFFDCALDTLYLGRNLKYDTSSSYGYSPFANNKSLTSVTIGNSVTSIGSYAFEGCSGLTNVTIPNSVTSIGNCAFYDCSSLKNLCIEDGYTELSLGYNLKSNNEGQGLFFDCALDTLYLGRNLKYDTSSSYGYSPFANNKSLTSVTIGNSVTSIGYYAFYDCTGLTSVTIPNSVTSIGGSAFSGCSGLTSVNIPNSVTSIGSSAFSGCSGLTSVHTNDIAAWCNISFANTSANPTYYAKKIYLDNSMIKNLVLSENVSSVANYAFYNCSSITGVEISNSVKTIGSQVFEGCNALRKVIIKDGTSALSLGNNYNSSSGGKGLFYDCPLDSVYIGRNTDYSSGSYYGFSPFANKRTLSSVAIGNSVTRISSYAFQGCTALKSITIPSSVTSIYSGAFTDCSGLTSVHTNNLTAWCKISFGDEFSNPTYYAHTLYLNGEEIRDLVIPSGIWQVKSHAFTYCSRFLTLSIPSSVTSIGTGAFNNCYGINKVSIPYSVKSIGADAFNNCYSLSDIECYASEPPSVDETTFSAYTYSNAALFVPASSKEKYNAVQIWRDFTRINNLTDIEALKLSKDVAVMTVGKSLTLIANVVCDNPASKTVTWTSSNESVATVSNGVVTALKAGKSTITAICEDVKATCEVTVNEKSDLSFIVPDITVCPTESFSLPIELENTLEVSAFQCDVYLPEGITLQKNSKGKYDVTLNVDRCDDHTVSAVEQEDGSIRLVAFSMTSSSISDTEGALFNLNLIAGEEIGTYTVEVKNINVSDANGNLTYLSDAAGTIEVYYKLGDANGDGSVLVNDVVYTVNKILGIEADDFIFRAADMNGDGNILVNDVVLIVNTILGVKPSTAALAPRHMNAFETLSVADSRTAYGMTEFGITLSNAGRYTAMQFDMEIAEGADIADIKVSMPTDHSVAYRRIDDTIVRVVVTSLTNEALAEGTQLSISMKNAAGKTVAFTNGRAACNNGQMVGIMPGSTVLGGTTGIDGINAEFAPADVYSIDGRIVKKNATTLDGLKPGLYVVNGRKVVVER